MIHRIIWQLRPNRLNNFSCRISSKWCKANISSFSSCPGHLLIHIFNIFKVYFFDLIVFETCILSYLRCECNSSSCVSDTAFVISSLECLPKLKRNKNREIKEIFAPIFNQRANEFVQQIGYIQMSDENACFGVVSTKPHNFHPCWFNISSSRYFGASKLHQSRYTL